MEGDAKEKLGSEKETSAVVANSSPCSSPSQEFSFTISFHHPSPLSRCHVYDLAPADDIFFRGHLLPLQILPLAVPPAPPAPPPEPVVEREARERIKKKRASSLFSGVGKWWKVAAEGEEHEEKRRKKPMAAVDSMSRMLKKYARVLEPLFFFRGSEKRRQLQRRPCSFTENHNSREVTKKMERSAPASMRTSPANSGVLVGPASCGGSSENSTMEELQSAIEAAIAHCKNSISEKKEAL